MLPKLSPTSAARLPHAACGPVCAELVRPVQCGCARRIFSSPNPGSQENDRRVPPMSPRLDRRRKATFGANHPQGVFPCLCSPRSLATVSLHHLGKCSKFLEKVKAIAPKYRTELLDKA